MKIRWSRHGLFKKAITYTYFFTYLCAWCMWSTSLHCEGQVHMCGSQRHEVSASITLLLLYMCVHPCVHTKSLNTFSTALILSALGLQPHDSGSPLFPVTRTHPRDNTSEPVWGEAKQLSEAKQQQGKVWASPTGWQLCATLWRNRTIKPVLWEPDRRVPWETTQISSCLSPLFLGMNLFPFPTLRVRFNNTNP